MKKLKEEQELEILRERQRDHTRPMTQEEFDRLQHLAKKFAPKGSPTCKECGELSKEIQSLQSQLEEKEEELKKWKISHKEQEKLVKVLNDAGNEQGLEFEQLEAQNKNTEKKG